MPMTTENRSTFSLGPRTQEPKRRGLVHHQTPEQHFYSDFHLESFWIYHKAHGEIRRSDWLQIQELRIQENMNYTNCAQVPDDAEDALILFLVTGVFRQFLADG